MIRGSVTCVALSSRSKRVAGAPPAFRVADKETALDEQQNVTESGVLGTLGELRIFRCRELPREAIKETVEHKTLPVVDRHADDRVPEARLGKDCGQSGVCAVDGAAQTAEEPFQPGRDVHRPLLRGFECAVIRVTLLPDLR